IGINATGQQIEVYLHVPVDEDDVKTRLAFQNVFVNSSMMFRLAALRSTHGYYDGLCEDYEMAVQLNFNHFLTNLDEELVKYRIHANNTTSLYAEKMFLAEKYVIGCIHRQLGIEEKDDLIEIHHSLVMGHWRRNSFSISEYRNLLVTLKRANS